MKKCILFSLTILFTSLIITKADCQSNKTTSQKDSLRISELNSFWNEVSRTVQTGDFEGYKATYHNDAVCVFTTGKNKKSTSVALQLELWKKGFMDTKAGKNHDKVDFRFSQRVGDENTAHETGIFYYTSVDKDGKVLTKSFIHFEGLLVKQKGVWKSIMEYQKTETTQKEWDALPKLQ